MSVNEPSTGPAKLSLFRRHRDAFVIGGALTVVLLSWLFVPDWVGRCPAQPGVLGGIGDSYESVSALFTGLAFVGLVYTIVLQRRELELQRQELRDTRGVLQEQQAALEKQSETASKQAFESTFFQLLKLHIEIADSVGGGGQGRTGRDYFASHYRMRLDAAYVDAWNERPGEQDKEVVSRHVRGVFEEQTANLLHYYRNLHCVVDFVERSGRDEREWYLGLVRAQLSPYELQVLFYVCLSDFGGPALSGMVERNALLSGLGQNDLLHPDHYAWLAPSAFGQRERPEPAAS